MKENYNKKSQRDDIQVGKGNVKDKYESISETMDNKDISGSMNGSQTNTYDKTYDTNPEVKRNTSSLLPDIVRGQLGDSKLMSDDIPTNSIIKVKGHELIDDIDSPDLPKTYVKVRSIVDNSPYNSRRKKHKR